MILIAGCVLLLLFVISAVLEIVTGRKRGGCLSSFRLFTVILAGVLAVVLTYVAGKILITEKFITLPTELIPAVHDLAYAFAIPVVALIVFLVLKLIMLIVYAIGAGALKKGTHAEACVSDEKGVKAKGLVCGIIISVIIAGFLVIPCYRGAKLYSDYKVLEPSFMKLYNYSQGGKVSTGELISAVDELSEYILDVDYISDDAKVQAINYGVGIVNDMMSNSGIAVIGSLSLGTYDSVEEHRQQVDSLVGIAKTMDSIGLLDAAIGNNTGVSAKTESNAFENKDAGREESTETSGEVSAPTAAGGLDAEKVLDAISDESTARSFVEAIGMLDNGNEMLANVINETVKEMSNGELSNLVDAEAFANPENSEAVVQTLTHAGTFTNLSEESFKQMSDEEKQGLIDELNLIRGYGVMDSATIDKLISQIKAQMK